MGGGVSHGVGSGLESCCRGKLTIYLPPATYK